MGFSLQCRKILEWRLYSRFSGLRRMSAIGIAIQSASWLNPKRSPPLLTSIKKTWAYCALFLTNSWMRSWNDVSGLADNNVIPLAEWYTLQMKGRWESNINVWFPFMSSQKWNCAASLLPKENYRIIMFCLPIPTLVYIFPGSDCLFCCSQIFGLILGIYKSLTDTWMWKLGLKPWNSQKRNT